MQVTVPVPLPDVVSENVTVGGTVLKVAVTVVFALRVTTQVPMPVQPPPVHPAKVDPPEGVAVRVTTVPPA